MTTKEKLDAFYAGMGALAQQLGFMAVTVHVQVDDNIGVSTWWPGCSASCPHPTECAAKVFHGTAHVLEKRVVELIDSEATIIDARHTSALN